MDTELLQKSIGGKRNSGMIRVQSAVERTVWVAGLPAKGAFKGVCLQAEECWSSLHARSLDFSRQEL